LIFQQAVIADGPIGTAPYRVVVIGDEADLLDGYVLIEFIPISRIGLDDQAPLHRRRMIKLDFALQIENVTGTLAVDPPEAPYDKLRDSPETGMVCQYSIPIDKPALNCPGVIYS
jgi:hypothetical protein